MNKAQQEALHKLGEVFTSIPFNKLLELELIQLDAHHIIMQFRMKPELIGNFSYGILHGGVISSALDMAGGMVVMASAISKHEDKTFKELTTAVSKCSTVDLSINYLNPGRGDLFIADAWLVKSGKLLSFARMELHNEEKKLIASAHGTYLMR